MGQHARLYRSGDYLPRPELAANRAPAHYTMGTTGEEWPPPRTIRRDPMRKQNALSEPRRGQHSISHLVDYELVSKTADVYEAERVYRAAGMCLPHGAWHSKQVDADRNDIWTQRHMNRMTSKVVGTTIDKLIQREVRDDEPTTPEVVDAVYGFVRRAEMKTQRWKRRDETRGDSTPQPPVEHLDDRMLQEVAAVATAGAEMVLRRGAPLYQHARWTATDSPCDYYIPVQTSRCSYGIVDWRIRGAKRGWTILADIKSTKRHVVDQPKAQVQLIAYLIADAARAYDERRRPCAGIVSLNPRRGVIEWIDIYELMTFYEQTVSAICEHVLGYDVSRTQDVMTYMRAAADAWHEGEDIAF